MATVKQKRAAKIKLEDPTKSMRQVMKEAGYSQVVADNPRNLSESKGWREMMDEYLPDKDLYELHKKFLNKKEAFVVSDGSQVGGHVEFTEQPHTDALKALIEANKLKRRYNDINIGQALIINVPDGMAKKYGISSSTGTDSD